MEKEHMDVVVVGGGAAGLSAALMLARSRRRVVVVDVGRPRNAPAAGVHGLLGHDGVPPGALLERGRAEVEGYGGQVIDDEAVRIAGHRDDFTVELAGGRVLAARRLVIATGLVDELPDIPGVAEQWGHGVLHCPYCHGWEVRDQRIGVLARGPASVHQALLFSQLSDDVVVFSGEAQLAAEDRSRLDAVGVRVLPGAVARVETEDGAVRGVRLDDGTLVERDAVVVATTMVARVGAFSGIGIEPTAHPMGSFIEADEWGCTAVPGVWVAGNASDLSAQVGAAAAAGARAGAHINADLVMADVEAVQLGVA